ncbi:MAG: hypothetical protein ACPG5B_15775 [Chitinophagales bacterium]
MKSISTEMKENKIELESVIKEHQQLSDTIEHYKQDNKTTIGEIINKMSGVRGVNIKNTAWKALTSSRIDLVTYEKISILTSIDEGKDNMKMQLERLTDLIYNNIGSTNTLDKELFKIIVNDLLYTEEELLESQKEFLQLNK